MSLRHFFLKSRTHLATPADRCHLILNICHTRKPYLVLVCFYHASFESWPKETKNNNKKKNNNNNIPILRGRFCVLKIIRNFLSRLFRHPLLAIEHFTFSTFWNAFLTSGGTSVTATGCRFFLMEVGTLGIPGGSLLTFFLAGLAPSSSAFSSSPPESDVDSAAIIAAARAALERMRSLFFFLEMGARGSKGQTSSSDISALGSV